MKISLVIRGSSASVEGKFPKQALRHVLEWCELNQEELLQNWETMQTTGQFIKIKPLE